MEQDGTATAIVDFDDIENVYYDDRDGISWQFIKQFLTGDDTFDLFHVPEDTPSMNNMEEGNFNKILAANGFDVTWSDIADLYDDTLEDDEMFTEDQASEIIEDIDDNFYDGMGMSTVYSDCERYGTENEAYKSIKDELFSELYLDKEYGVRDGKVKIVLPRERIVDCFKNYFFDYGKNIFELLRSDAEYDGEVEKISIREPYNGYSGFDDELWTTAVDDFAKKVVEILSRQPKQGDSSGQMHFDFDKEYLDNPKNIRRSEFEKGHGK